MSRLSLLEALRDGPLTVTALIERPGLTQSNVSNHLACLRDCGLVIASSQQRYTLYHLSDERVAILLRIAEAFLAENAHGGMGCHHYQPTHECALSPPHFPSS